MHRSRYLFTLCPFFSYNGLTDDAQALNFLSTHGSTIAILLKNEDEHVTLPTLAEVHLIIALCTSILPSVPKTEVVCRLCLILRVLR